MGPKEQGRLLRAWRKHLELTLEEAAGRILEEAEKQGVPDDARSVPRTYPALIRWEKGAVKSHKLHGLQIIADAYGVSLVDLMREPPSKQPANEDDTEDAATIDLFREFLRARKSR